MAVRLYYFMGGIQYDKLLLTPLGNSIQLLALRSCPPPSATCNVISFIPPPGSDVIQSPNWYCDQHGN